MTKKSAYGANIDLTSDKWRTAIHEAGHVVILRHYGMVFDSAMAFDVPESDESGTLYGCVTVGENDRLWECDNRVAVQVYAAGITAEMMFGVLSDRISTNDAQGIADAFLRMGTPYEPNEIAKHMTDVSKMLAGMVDDIATVAAGLYKYGVLSYNDVRDILDRGE